MKLNLAVCSRCRIERAVEHKAEINATVGYCTIVDPFGPSLRKVCGGLVVFVAEIEALPPSPLQTARGG